MRTSTIGRRGCISALAAALVLTLPPTTPPAAVAGPEPAATVPATVPAITVPAADLRARGWRTRSARFKMATFNILGSQHTRGSRRYAPGTRRARITAGLIRGRGVGLVGFQEVQADQLRVLRAELDGYGIWPRASLGRGGKRLQFAWRRTRFRLLRGGTITTTFDHHRRPVPWVELRDRRSGARFFVVNIHNSPRGQERARDRATRQELDLVRRLRQTRRPVFVIGDTNERTEFFCRAVRWAGMHAANGGTSDRRGCRPPRRPILDQVFGDGNLRWLDYEQVRNARVRRASDHNLVLTKVEVTRWVRR